MVCDNAAKFFNVSTIISWDISIDHNGNPIIIEFNLTFGGISSHQISRGPLFGNEIDSIKVSHEESQNFKSLDEWDFYNYADNFDWGAINEGRFIASMDGIYITSQSCNAHCKRCYTNAITNCYKCESGYVLKGMTCVYADSKKYLKVPITKGNIEFQITNVPGL